ATRAAATEGSARAAAWSPTLGFAVTITTRRFTGNETRVPTRRADRIASRPQPPRRGNLDQPGWRRPSVSYVSSRPWRRQERARVGVAPAHLYRPFQGRTVEDADRRANGACLPVPAGTRFCECGAVVIHNSHELGKLHRHRTQATQPSSRESSQERSGAAVRAMLARAAQEADFAQWLLRVASGHASSESPPAPLSITATVERGAAGPGETLVAAALTPEVASMTLEAAQGVIAASAGYVNRAERTGDRQSRDAAARHKGSLRSLLLPEATCAQSAINHHNCRRRYLQISAKEREIPRRSGVATQAIATETTVPSKSADCGNTSRRRPETTPSLVIRTAQNAAAADLAAGESVAATATTACSTSSMHDRAARIDATFLTTADRKLIERRTQQKAAELSSVSATNRKINVLASQRGTESSSAPTYTMIDLDMVNSLLNEHSACQVCRGQMTIEHNACNQRAVEKDFRRAIGSKRKRASSVAFQGAAKKKYKQKPASDYSAGDF
ncbi:hypothetical protein MRX96_053857, partial [Rhipicephalus microplus]